jgi:preprotein translocase subunit SecA
MQPGEPIYHPLLNRSIEKAQTKVEERNFEIRKHLLEYDDVMNQQRKFIYEQRDSILADEDLVKRVDEASVEIADAALDKYAETSRKDGAAALRELTETLKRKFNISPDAAPAGVLASGAATSGAAASAAAAGLVSGGARSIPVERLRPVIIEALEKDISGKEALVGKQPLNEYIRFMYLRFIDQKWLDHLENMEALREAVHLRSYAQKNPLTEYKLEGFQLFDEMIDSIRGEIASRIHLVRIQAAPARQDSGETRTVSASHGSMAAFEGARQAAMSQARAETGSGAAQGSVTVKRSYPKTGRNEPCPCGSGKKYKYCHGR